MPDLPTLRWGIISTGMISSWFVHDLSLDRTDARAQHVIQAIGSSSTEKGKQFVDTYMKKYSLPNTPTIGSYDEVYADPNVDAVYIGLPHSMHKEAALKAIAHNKHVLCEKPFAINSKDAKEMFDAAKEAGVFIMEALWVRFFPIVQELKDHIHVKKTIGNINRLFCDFGLDLNLDKLGDDSRLKSPELGAGALLDVGVYTLTFFRMFLDDKVGDDHVPFEFSSVQTVKGGIDYASSLILKTRDGKQAILTSSLVNKTKEEYMWIEGDLGRIEISGPGGSMPFTYNIIFYDKSKESILVDHTRDIETDGYGFMYEADAVAVDISKGKTEDDIMPPKETLLVMGIMDKVRKDGGVVYPQDF